MTGAEQARAKLSQTYTDIIVGPQRDDNFPGTRAGVRAGDLSQDQRELLIRAIETYVRDINPPDAGIIIAKYRTELPDTYVAYSGTPPLRAERHSARCTVSRSRKVSRGSR